jgi:hypothetical protein
MIKSNFLILPETDKDAPLVIRDVGPWHLFKTVTNDAENVVEYLYRIGLLVNNKRLLYYDSDGRLDELLHENGTFKDFRALPQT